MSGGILRNVTAIEVACPTCGDAVEVFSDEQRRTCPRCGTKVSRDAVPACASWCPSAITCIGKDRYKALLDSGAVQTTGGPEHS